MQSQIAYCSACDQDVHVVVTDGPTHEGQAPLADAQIVCLDFGARCTGSMCPMFGLPRILMGVRLAQSGLRPEAFETISAPCPACETLVDLQMLDDQYVFCPACATRSKWIRLQIGDADYVALASVGSGD
jgi:hypothetical protein